MLKVTIELLPYGNRLMKRTLNVVEIENIGAEGRVVNYRVRVNGTITEVRGVDRERTSAFRLVALAFNALIAEHAKINGGTPDMSEHVFVFKEGRVTTLYTDVIDLRALGALHVKRASNIEWCAARNGWTVQFADGVFLAARGLDVPALNVEEAAIFETREAALAAEVAYIQARL